MPDLSRFPDPFDHTAHDAKTRLLPVLPKPGERIKVIIDTDIGCELDDQYAVAVALGQPERLDIVGFTTTHIGSLASMDRCWDEMHKVLALAGREGDFTVKRGAPALQWVERPEDGPAVQFIIEEALKASPENPLYIVVLGNCTNIACAYMQCPEIADNVVIIYHVRGRWPDYTQNFNVWGDIKASRQVFRSRLRMVMYDTGTYIRWPIEEAEKRIKPYGPLGEYLYELRNHNETTRRPDRGHFDIGDVVFLVDPSSSEYEECTCPTLKPDTRYNHQAPCGQIIRVVHTRADACLDMLEDSLKKVCELAH